MALRGQFVESSKSELLLLPLSFVAENIIVNSLRRLACYAGTISFKPGLLLSLLPALSPLVLPP